LTWWVFLYVYAVLPWMYAAPTFGQYNFAYTLVTNVQNAVIVVGFGVLWLRAQGAWRFVYANLFGAASTYLLTSLLVNVAIGTNSYKTGSLYDVPLIASFLWYGTAGLIAHKKEKELDAPTEMELEGDDPVRETTWATRLAMTAVISLPLFALYTLRF